MMPDVHTLYDVVEVTWPPASRFDDGPLTLRNGAGGGKRVAAATARQPVTADKLPAAEAAMRAMGQTPLFMIRDGDAALDHLLEQHGYRIIDPVNLYVGDVALLTAEPPARVTTFTIWEPLAIMRDIWATGGIGPDRVAVMERAACPKTTIFGRDNNRPAGAGYVGIHKGIAMVHALEILEPHRGAGLGKQMMRRAALWASEHGAQRISAVCTQANEGANALYASLGLSLVGTYHYRIKEDP
ncbi:MAG: GNAT family N-acetyltransferase [Roseovarius sp.]